MESLATLDDATLLLARDITAAEQTQLTGLLAAASAMFRSYTGQHFTQAETTARLRLRNNRIHLPQRPVTAVDTIVDMNDAAIAFEWWGGDVIDLTTRIRDTFEVEPWRTGPQWVDVTYTHGYATIPADVVAVVAQIATRVLGRPADTTGISSETLGAYSYTVGAAAAAGTSGMLNDERAVGDRYKRIGGSILTPSVWQ